jgi:hypothetical protein
MAKSRPTFNLNDNRKKLWMQVHWDDDSREGEASTDNITYSMLLSPSLSPVRRSNAYSSKRPATNDRQLVQFIKYGMFSEANWLLDCPSVRIKCFGLIFDALYRSSSCYVYSGACLNTARRVVLLQSFRSAPNRSVLTSSFLQMCLACEEELGDLIIDVLVERRPSTVSVVKLFHHRRLTGRVVSLLRRWTDETDYPLPLRTSTEMQQNDARDMARVLTDLYRQNRLLPGFSMLSTPVANIMFEGIDSDHCFWRLANYFMAQGDEESGEKDVTIAACRQFTFYGCVFQKYRRRFLHASIVETMLALAPLNLPVYLTVELLAYLVPQLAEERRTVWPKYTAVATNIKRAHQRATIQKISVNKQSKIL